MNLIKIGRYYINPEAVTQITGYASPEQGCVVHLIGDGPGLTLSLPAEEVAKILAETIDGKRHD